MTTLPVVPTDTIIADANGRLTYPWHQFFNELISALNEINTTLATTTTNFTATDTTLSEAAVLMDVLVPGVSTLFQQETAWEEFRVKLQELV